MNIIISRLNTLLVIFVALLSVTGCTNEEVLFESHVSTAYREPVVEDENVTFNIPISTSNFWILEASLEISKSESMNNSKLLSITDNDLVDSAGDDTNTVSEYQLKVTDLEPSTRYYWRVIVRGFTGHAQYTGEISSIKFEKNEFKTGSIDYKIFTSGLVDLGLSVKWNATNLDASFPTNAGIKSGWGDPSGTITSDNEEDYGGKNPPSNISGSSLDICTSILGKNYRTPTYNEYTELINGCSWKFGLYRGVYGWTIIGKNGNAIFMPGTNDADKFVLYWSSSLNTTTNNGIFLALYNGEQKNPGCYSISRSTQGYYRPVENK